MLLLNLFKTFFIIGLVSFGGGYAMLPLIEIEVTNNNWMTVQELTDTIAIAGMAPGSIATNSAVLIGFQIAGLPGALISAVGMTLPSLLIILIVSTFFFKVNNNESIQSAFYGLRPIIVGLIIYAAIKFTVSNELINSISLQTFSTIMIFLLAFFGLNNLKFHPVFVILISGVIGVIIYS